ncbi:hypothetical protein B4102_3641 [Heyndrickxia sporothermodurans]|uniref:AraC effector-binding domain-containing protein n=2 Tax=Heyndrickxia sporothermodurans TaxID=46224 RepID=A0A150KMR7_9BACI|nr:hypothetical protein B4102_3641 [Heyndrickxia sporothermodurans]
MGDFGTNHEKGDGEMNSRIEEMNRFSIVGVKKRVNTKQAFDSIPTIWAQASEQGLFDQLFEIGSFDHKVRGLLGVCSGGNFGKNEEFDYILAIASNQEPSEGMVKMDFPDSTWIVFEVPGPPALQEAWDYFYSDWIPNSPYELANLPAIECYLPIEENKNELWIPISNKE